MTWNSTLINGGISVKANKTRLNNNNTYIETTMGNTIIGDNTASTKDHFWNVSGTLDGHHRFFKSPKFTNAGGSPLDPDFSPVGIDGIIYLKEMSDGSTQGYYRNAENIYQFIPKYKTSTHKVTSSYTNMTTVPDNTYGEIFMYNTTGGTRYDNQIGFFRASGGFCNAYSIGFIVQGGDSAVMGVKFGNGSDGSGLNIRVRSENAAADLTWTYKIIIRDL